MVKSAPNTAWAQPNRNTDSMAAAIHDWSQGKAPKDMSTGPFGTARAGTGVESMAGKTWTPWKPGDPARAASEPQNAGERAADDRAAMGVGRGPGLLHPKAEALYRPGDQAIAHVTEARAAPSAKRDAQAFRAWDNVTNRMENNQLHPKVQKALEPMQSAIRASVEKRGGAEAREKQAEAFDAPAKVKFGSPFGTPGMRDALNVAHGANAIRAAQGASPFGSPAMKYADSFADAARAVRDAPATPPQKFGSPFGTPGMRDALDIAKAVGTIQGSHPDLPAGAQRQFNAAEQHYHDSHMTGPTQTPGGDANANHNRGTRNETNLKAIIANKQAKAQANATTNPSDGTD